MFLEQSESVKVLFTSVTPWTVTHQASLSMEFFRQEYWSGLPFSSPGALSDPGIEPGYSGLQECSLPLRVLFLCSSFLGSFLFGSYILKGRKASDHQIVRGTLGFGLYSTMFLREFPWSSQLNILNSDFLHKKQRLSYFILFLKAKK